MLSLRALRLLQPQARPQGCSWRRPGLEASPALTSQTLQALSGCPEKLLHHMGSLGQIIVPCLAEGEILLQNLCVIIFPGPKAVRQRRDQEDVCGLPALPTGHTVPQTGTGPHRQGQGGDATRAPSRCCWGRWMCSRLFIKPAYCSVSPWPGSPSPPSSHPPSPAPCIPPQAWHSRSTALQTPLLNPNLLRDCQAFPDSPIDPAEPPKPPPLLLI